MFKKVLWVMAFSCLVLSFFTGCGNDTESKNVETTQSASSINTVEGTLEEKKDFMFTVTDRDDNAYAFSFDEKPEGYDKFQNGDKVTVEYKGEISAVDAFTGEIISIKMKN